MIKRISDASAFFTAKEKLASVMYWPLRPEQSAKFTAKLSQERLPQSLHSHPLGHKPKAEEIQ
jgi:hypothetical protein